MPHDAAAEHTHILRERGRQQSSTFKKHNFPAVKFNQTGKGITESHNNQQC